MLRGKSFLSDNEKTPSGKLKRHLRIIITNPDFENNYVVITVQTLRGTFMDTTCIIEKGEHPFIKHTSVVNFSKTLMMNEHEIINGIQRGLLIDKKNVSQSLLEKLQKAAISSDKISENIKQILLNNL